MTNPPPRDWDKELADIDKVVARQVPAPAPMSAPAGALPSPRATAVPAATPRRAAAVAWLWAGLSLLLAVALPLWPYATACGMQLSFYLGAIGLTMLVGLWGAMASWRARRGVAQCISLLTVAWAMVLLAGAVLPRIGYAKLEQTWLCP